MDTKNYFSVTLGYSCLMFLAAFVPLATTHADSAMQIDLIAEQMRETDSELEALREKIALNKKLKDELQVSVLQLNEKKTERELRIDELNHRIEQFDERLVELENSISKANAAVQQRKTLLAKSLDSSRSIATHSELRTFLQHNDPTHAQRLGTYQRYFFEAQEKQILESINYLSSIEELHLTTLKDRNWLNHIRGKATQQREDVTKHHANKRQQIDTIDSELESSTRTVAQLQQDQQRLQTLMEELKKTQRARSGYFASLKGNMKLPVEGKISAKFGDTKSVGKINWQGLFIDAAEGVSVKAAADGEVVYSDHLQGFGVLVILDHGDGYMTLYGGNRTVLHQTGTWLESGATIATVGDSGGQNKSGLYFEIRHNATALDPKDWLSLVARES